MAISIELMPLCGRPEWNTLPFTFSCHCVAPAVPVHNCEFVYE